MEKTKKMKPYGLLFSQKREYYLLAPQPIARDSCWDNNTYTFFVAQRVAGEGEEVYEALHVVTNSFIVEYFDDIQPIDVLGILQEAGPVEYDVLSPAEQMYLDEPLVNDVASEPVETGA